MAAPGTRSLGILELVRSPEFLARTQVISDFVAPGLSRDNLTAVKDLFSEGKATGAIDYDLTEKMMGKYKDLDLAVRSANLLALYHAQTELAKTSTAETPDEKIIAAKNAIAHLNNALNLWVNQLSTYEPMSLELKTILSNVRGLQPYFLELMITYDIPISIESMSGIAAAAAASAYEESPRPADRDALGIARLFGTMRRGDAFSITGADSEARAALEDLRGGGSGASAATVSGGAAGGSGASSATAFVPGAHYFAMYLKDLLKFYQDSKTVLMRKEKFIDFRALLRGEIIRAHAFIKGEITPPDLPAYISQCLQIYKGYPRPAKFNDLLAKFGRVETALGDGKFNYSLNREIVAGFDALSPSICALTLDEESQLRTIVRSGRRLSMSDLPGGIATIPRKAVSEEVYGGQVVQFGVEVAPTLLPGVTLRTLGSSESRTPTVRSALATGHRRSSTSTAGTGSSPAATAFFAPAPVVGAVAAAAAAASGGASPAPAPDSAPVVP